MSEQWRPVLGYEGFYEVSNEGRVRSLGRWTATKGSGRRWARGRNLRPAVGHAGHLRVDLSVYGKKRLHSVHVLVLEAFVGPRPPGMHCCHWDGDPQNNHVANLRWDTPAANSQDTLRHGRHPGANRTHCPQGHPYDEENTCYLSRGGRRCRTCQRDKERARRRVA